MPTDNLDDLFRDRLAGHATPPGEALWARLQAADRQAQPPEAAAGPHAATGAAAPGPVAPEIDAADAARLDARFQRGLGGHSTVPGRHLWERLEDEHLRPRNRRAAWWPLALAAAVALLLVAGGAGLWPGSPLGRRGTGPVAARRTGGSAATTPARGGQSATAPAVAAATLAAGASTPAGTGTGAAGTAAAGAAAAGAAAPQNAVTVQPAPARLTPSAATAGAPQKNRTAQATRPAALASSAPKADATTPGLARRRPTGPARPLDAAAGRTQDVARADASAPRPAAADERQPAGVPAPAVAQVAGPAAEIVPARPAVPAPARADQLITVDVRSGRAPAPRPAEALTAAVAAAAAEPAEGRRRLGGRLLQQAGHLVRGERVSLAEVTGLPETLTLSATVAGRRLSKSIQL